MRERTGPGYLDPASRVDYLRWTLCQPDLPHCGQCMRRRGLPAAFQRIPPRSQIERSKPQKGHVAIHVRDSASMSAAAFGDRNAANNRWTALITLPPAKTLARSVRVGPVCYGDLCLNQAATPTVSTSTAPATRNVSLNTCDVMFWPAPASSSRS